MGEILFLENRTTDWSRPEFVKSTIDSRTGTIHVPVIDLNGDGKPDFVALISQEHETVVAFINEGGGKFTPKTLYQAPHPAWGSSGIQLVDLNGDGKVDVLYTNGDILDEPYLWKPYHGIQWLENKGNLEFEYHRIADMYGVHNAVAANITGGPLPDVLAVSFLPADKFTDRGGAKPMRSRSSNRSRRVYSNAIRCCARSATPSSASLATSTARTRSSRDWPTLSSATSAASPTTPSRFGRTWGRQKIGHDRRKRNR